MIAIGERKKITEIIKTVKVETNNNKKKKQRNLCICKLRVKKHALHGCLNMSHMVINKNTHVTMRHFIFHAE